MIKNIDLKSRYTVPRDDLVNSFFVPLLKGSVKYDRVAGFFSSKALSYYAEGIEELAKKPNAKYRLLISEIISEEDYFLIKKGYELRKEIEEQIINRLDESLSIHEMKNFSNLSYLISIGLVDIKIGFIHKGLFHSKYGFFYDEYGNIVYFTGSINETENAIIKNYEEIFVYCNWFNDNFFYQNELKKALLDFEKMWNNQDDIVITIEPTKLIKTKLETFNRKRLINNEIELTHNSIILECKQNNITLLLSLDEKQEKIVFDDSIFEYFIEPYTIRNDNNYIYFREMSINELETLDLNVQKLCNKLELTYIKTSNFENFIKNKKLDLLNLNKIGERIKARDNYVLNDFLKFKSTVDFILDRKLKDQQMWDAFFMYKMKKSANFSVPGSGKTSSVLGCFSYLHSLGKIKKIVVVSPKNSFGTWIDEFEINLSKNIRLNVFNSHDGRYKSVDDKKRRLKYHSSDYNLFLFNYESISSFKDEIKNIISDDVLLVFDEVHKIKKINGKYAENSIEISKNANYTIVLTGTPIPNSYTDIYNILKILFFYEYDDFFGYQVNELKDISNFEIKKLNNKLFPFFCRTTKKDLNVPPVNEDIIFNCFANKNEQRIFEILHHTLKNNHLALFVRLMQLETNPKMLLTSISSEILKEVFEEDYEDLDNSQIKDYNNELFELVSKIEVTSKVEKCIELIKKLVSENKPIILWCIFKDTIKKFENILNNMNIVAKTVCGENDLEYRENIINDFKKNKIKVLITNPHTLAESISLHNICHDAIYFEYSYNLVHFLQSKDRIHRLGLKDDQYTQLYFMNVTYKINNHNFCFGEKIYNRLMEKENTMLECIENNVIENPQSMDEDLKRIFDNLD